MSEAIEPPKDDYADPSPTPNMTSYAQMGRVESRWARTERSWVNLFVMFLLVVLCIGANFLCVGMYYGWDALKDLLGWS